MSDSTPSLFPIVALVSSTGGLDALSRVLAPLPRTFGGAILALQHLSPDTNSRLPEILSSRTSLPVTEAEDGDLLTPGRVLVVPPARHLLVGTDERVRLIRSGALPPARPSADLLLCTLAVAHGTRAVAVVLTGRGTDGALGVQAVHTYGGVTLVQDEESAREPGMPAAAVLTDSPTPPLPLDEIADALLTMIQP